VYDIAMIIATPRTRLRCWEQTDRDAFAAMHADPVVMHDYGGPISRKESDAKLDRYAMAYRQHGFCRWAVESSEGAFLGYVSRITISDGLLIAEVDGLPSSASRRAVGIVGSGSSDAPSLIKRCAVRRGHQGPVLAVLATKRRLRVAPRGCALPLTAAAHGAL
jgi:Acetyltransferase (GNAT) domain